MFRITIIALTDFSIRHARPTGKDYTLRDSDGLSLAISAKGGRSWHFRYYWAARQQRMSLSDIPKSSSHAEKACQLILSGVQQCRTAEDQLLLLDSLACQCALFARLLSGEREFHALLERLKQVDFDTIGDLMPQTQH